MLIENKGESQAIFSVLKGPIRIIHLRESTLKFMFPSFSSEVMSTQYRFCGHLMLIRNSILTFVYPQRTKS